MWTTWIPLAALVSVLMIFTAWECRPESSTRHRNPTWTPVSGQQDGHTTPRTNR